MLGEKKDKRVVASPQYPFVQSKSAPPAKNHPNHNGKWRLASASWFCAKNLRSKRKFLKFCCDWGCSLWWRKLFAYLPLKWWLGPGWTLERDDQETVGNQTHVSDDFWESALERDWNYLVLLKNWIPHQMWVVAGQLGGVRNHALISGRQK